jgi:hypothetical protein
VGIEMDEEKLRPSGIGLHQNQYVR